VNTVGRYKRGAPRWSRKYVFLTPWEIAVIGWILRVESKKRGKAIPQAQIIRDLIQLGIDNYRRLGCLPAVKR
jgi:hypothetical protein